MSAKLPTKDAVEVARRVFASRLRGSSHPSRSQFLSAISEFEQVEFTVPDETDSDGFLFQYGPVNWYPEPTFIVGVTRQFRIVDPRSAEESYLQVAMDYVYAIDADLKAVGSASNWWFRGSGVEFSAWLHSVGSESIWQYVSGKAAREFVISVDEV